MRLRTMVFALVAVGVVCGAAVGGEDVAPAAGPRVSFGLIADVQYADRDDRETRAYRASLDKLEACVQDLNSRDLDFTIHLGDIVDRGPESFAEVLPRYEALTMPYYHVLGNHDFPLPRDQVLHRLGMESAYYSFSSGGWRFVVLDTADIMIGGGWPEDSENQRQAKEWIEGLRAAGVSKEETCNRCGIGAAQKEWLRTTLRDAAVRGERAIVFGHVPIERSFCDQWGRIHNREEIRQVLEDAGCVVAYFCGHAHEGGYAEREDIHYVVVQGMVETPNTTAYATVDVFDERLEIHGVGRVPDRTLALTSRSASAN